MEDIVEFFGLIRRKTGLRSYAAIAREVRIPEGNISNYTRGKSHPPDDIMIKFAKLAGIEPEVALLLVAKWRTDRKTKKIYDEMIRREERRIEARKKKRLRNIRGTNKHAA